MSETSGSMGGVFASRSNVTPSFGFAPRQTTEKETPLDKVSKHVEMMKASKMQKEYDRIMEKPKEERTFSEKMFVAQVDAEKALAVLNDVMKPTVMYCA